MQQLTITGYLSRDAEQRSTRSGDTVTALNVPVKQGWGEKEQTNWFRVNVWGKRANFAGELRKGDFIAVTGELSIGEYNGKPQYEIRASDFQTVKGSAREPDGSRGAPADNGGYSDDLDDSIPYMTSGGAW